MTEEEFNSKNLTELEEMYKRQKEYIFCQECANDFYYTKGTYKQDKATLDIIEKRIEEIKKQIEELSTKKDSAYSRYMYEECAERGYDHQAAKKAHDEYLQYSIELDKLIGRKEGEKENDTRNIE